MNKFFVFDTNSLVSASLIGGTITARAIVAFEKAKLPNIMALSMELAISANASCIITGDKDLLILNPFRNIPILNAVDFINNF